MINELSTGFLLSLSCSGTWEICINWLTTKEKVISVSLTLVLEFPQQYTFLMCLLSPLSDTTICKSLLINLMNVVLLSLFYYSKWDALFTKTYGFVVNNNELINSIWRWTLNPFSSAAYFEFFTELGIPEFKKEPY